MYLYSCSSMSTILSMEKELRPVRWHLGLASAIGMLSSKVGSTTRKMVVMRSGHNSGSCNGRKVGNRASAAFWTDGSVPAYHQDYDVENRLPWGGPVAQVEAFCTATATCFGRAILQREQEWQKRNILAHCITCHSSSAAAP